MEKRIKSVALWIISSIAILSCNNQHQEKINTDSNELTEIFPKGKKGTNNLFTGNAYPTALVDADSVYNTLVGNVYFEPGSRSNWHSHPAGQILIITAGIGYHQIEGTEIEIITKGDVIKCPPNVRHWHGASADVGLQQLYIIPNTNKGIVEWNEAVTDEQYSIKKSMKMTKTENTEHYTFTLSDKVTRQKISFKNRYGITLSGDLYLPKNAGNEKLSALAISGPFGAVKEQSSGLYANQMAERGFAVVAFDPSYTGESGGEPRNLASPEINTEDFSAAVDFLGLQKNVDREKIGIIGICGFGGFALNATAIDKRIKAVVASTMYDMTRVMSKGYNDAVTLEQRTKTLEQLSEQRWKDAEAGTFAYGAKLNGGLKGNEPQFLKEYYDYYRTPRGYHERSVNAGNAWTATSPLSFMNMPILTYIKEISPRPLLIIAGEKAHSRYFSETAFQSANEPKELVIVPNAVHVDLYDKIDVIPFDKMATFFKTMSHKRML